MGAGCLEASGGMEVSLHMCTCMCMHTCTCIHVKKLQMATDMEASMFIMFNMHMGVWVHVCMHVCAWYMGHPSHTHPQPSLPTHHPS